MPILAEHSRVDVDGSPVQLLLVLDIIEITPTSHAPTVLSDDLSAKIATGPPLSPLPAAGMPELCADQRVQ